MSEPFIPYGRQSIDDSDVAAVVAALRSDFLTQGPVVGQFEQQVADLCGARFGVAVNSATSALHIACMALDLGPGKRLWTIPNTFVATANCARYCGADVDFVDIDPETYTISIAALTAKLEQAAAAGTLPDVVAAVDFSGQPCNWQALTELKQRYGFALIDDASHALGAQYQSRAVGSLPGVDITIFSFHPVKIVATGEGGVAVTDDPELAKRLATLRTHGITKDAQDFELPSDGDWYYEQKALGYNYRMTELQAALGCSQLERLPAFLARRRALAVRYDQLLLDLPLQRPYQHADALSAWHLYVIQLDEPAQRKSVFDGLRAAGIGVQVHYIPVHLQPYYRRMGFRPGDYPAAEAYYARAISLPMFADLSDTQQDRVVATLTSLLVPGIA